MTLRLKSGTSSVRSDATVLSNRGTLRLGPMELTLGPTTAREKSDAAELALLSFMSSGARDANLSP